MSNHRQSSRRPRLVIGLLWSLSGLLCCLGACAPDERESQMADLARWQDRRLAPTDSLTSLLIGPDAHVRRAALRTAGLIGRTDVLPAMLAALDDPSLSVRCEAAFSLGLLGSEAAVAPLTRLLQDPHPAVREASILGLARLEHDGSMLFAPAFDGRAAEARAAWTALRHAVARANRDSLLAAIRAGLARPESEVRWRVLRCAELAADSTLVAQIAPYVMDRDVQVRVHALRALTPHSGPGALAAVLRGSERHGRLRGRDLMRVRVAELRALGRLAGPFLASAREEEHGSLAGRTTAVLSIGVADPDPAIAITALLAVTEAAASLILPPEAAGQESLLPVWRLRLVRNARSRLDDASPAVRAAACGALGALRGQGALDELMAMLEDDDPTVGAAALKALMRLSPGHDQVCDWTASLIEQHGPAGLAVVLQALPVLVQRLREEGSLQDPVTRFPRRLDPACLPSLAWSIAARALQRDDHALRAQGASLLADLPADSSRRVLVTAWQAEMARGNPEVQLALLEAIARLFELPPADGSRPEFTPRRHECLFFAGPGLPPSAPRDAAPDVAASDLDDQPAALVAAEALTAAFDLRDLRLRLAAREAALVTGLLRDPLIPTAASLRETLPAHRRHELQPSVARPETGTIRVRCTTERGIFEIALDAENAPNTVASFLDLIARGFHDDLIFHRVVEDFVFQGGCPRGDGWGGPDWTLRCEYSPRPFERGTVGMAHAGKDTGGSQWFVCLSPQPHLDGRYTVFGEVIRGLDVLDLIEYGDRYRLEVLSP